MSLLDKGLTWICWSSPEANPSSIGLSVCCIAGF